jgi:hypothetical protein
MASAQRTDPTRAPVADEPQPLEVAIMLPHCNIRKGIPRERLKSEPENQSQFWVA